MTHYPSCAIDGPIKTIFTQEFYVVFPLYVSFQLFSIHTFAESVIDISFFVSVFQCLAIFFFIFVNVR